jgi:hypothetical protein
MDDSTNSMIPIVLGILLSVSEIMPFIKNVESNGMLHTIVNLLSKLGNSVKSMDLESQSLLDGSSSSLPVLVHSELCESGKYQMEYIINSIRENYSCHKLTVDSLTLENKTSLLYRNYKITELENSKGFLIEWV